MRRGKFLKNNEKHLQMLMIMIIIKASGDDRLSDTTLLTLLLVFVAR